MSHYKFHLFVFIIITVSSIKSVYIFDYSHIEGSKINIEVGKLSSYIIPYSYNRLRICNLKRIQRDEDNLGEILTVEDLYISDYTANINEIKYCEAL